MASHNGFGALQAAEEGATGGKTCSRCGETKGEHAFSRKQWAAKAHSRRCSQCVASGEDAGAKGEPGASPAAAAGGQRIALGAPDLMTLQDLAVHLATARAMYHKNSSLPDEAVCKLMLTTRMRDLPLARCKIAPSTLVGAGNGLFATRDIAEGELITLYPVDALLLWEDAEHSTDSTVQIFFSKHVPASERDVARAVTEWRGYEVPCNERVSVVADPRRADDSAYLAHMSNDAAICASADEQDDYERKSAAGANAIVFPLDVDELDSNGLGQVLHFAQRALKPIKSGEEIFVSYGVGYWELSASGLFQLPPGAASN
jgi:hypothetical protein